MNMNEKDSKFYIPTTCSEDWKRLLAKEDHWRDNYSAKLLADSWQQANDFPTDVRSVFKKSGIPLFQNVELLLAFPEYKVSLPGGSRASQNDIFVLAKGNDQLISIMVEGKKSESFGETLAEWRKDSSAGKKKRLEFLCENLKIADSGIDLIRYQLFHRTVSALLAAKKFNANNALMMVHSFSETNESFDDYKNYLALFNVNNVKPDSLVFAKNINGIDLYFAWVKISKSLGIKNRKLPHMGVCMRLAPSRISGAGVGVFAITKIKKDTDIFYDEYDKMIWINGKELESLPAEVRKLYDDFCVIKENGTRYGCPKSFNQLIPCWYLNSSDSPNVRCDEKNGYKFYALRDIDEGEELTVDYTAYSELPS